MSFDKIIYWAFGISAIFLLPSLSFSQILEQKIYDLSKEDELTVRTILKFSMGSMDTVSKDMHSAFWEVINKNGGNPDNINDLGPKKQLIDFINSTGIFYQRTFYKDALVSYTTGKSFKSEERKKLEENFERDRIKENALLMEKIASKKFVTYNGMEIVIDEIIINGIIENLDVAMNNFIHNINILYSKNYNKQ